MQRFIVSAGFTACWLLFIFFSVAAQTAPTYSIQPYLTGLSSPLYFTTVKDGTKRNFVVEQGGVIKVFQPGSTAAEVFLNISTKVSVGGECGLLGLAFHPQFASNGYFFVNYTNTLGNTVIARYKAINNNSVADPNSELILLTITQPYSNHNGGMIEFGPDNNLYIGMGDGGSGNDPQNNALNINSLLGKMLRITPSVEAAPAAPYTVPADNPYAGATPGADEIYAIGLRNPFRWSFDRGGSRQLWAGDVGQSTREEVDVITKGGNYGWRIMEGFICNPGINANCTPPADHIPPVLDYGHTGGRCSITGGYVYRGARATLPNGAYVYGDYCTGEIWMWQNNQQILLIDTPRNISSFGEDEAGEIYVVGIGSGTVERLTRTRTDAIADYDGDGRTDFTVYRPNGGFWYILNNSNYNFKALQFGLGSDIVVPADFDGDDIADIAVFRASSPNAFFYYIRSSDNTFQAAQWGTDSDVPVAADYDGDGRDDFAVFRRGTVNNPYGTYYILRSTDNNFTAAAFSGAVLEAVPGDYDGDGKADTAVWESGSAKWIINNSGNNSRTVFQFGIFSGSNNDIAVPADYDGDGKTDIAVYRPSGGMWFAQRSSAGFTAAQFGTGTDFPVAGDYDGDGKDDFAVFRPSNGVWYVLRSSISSDFGIQFGQTGDRPLPYYSVPHSFNGVN